MSKKLTVCIMSLFILFSINRTAYSLSSNSNESSESYQSLSETIDALDITRKKYQDELFSVNNTLKKEYSIFIDYLSFQIDNYCQKIIKDYGEQSVQNLPCNPVNIQAMNHIGYQTSEEKIESLENEFMIGLGEFDEMLLIEDEQIAQISKSKNNGGSDSSAGGAQGEYAEGNGDNKENEMSETDNDGEENGTSDSNESEDGASNESSNSSKTNRNTKREKNKSYQRRKLDKIDDDIVARQLKEAAEKETNPELKEKLWDEYYKYKQTIGK